MSPVDLEDNPEVHVRVMYGESQGMLFKMIDERKKLGRVSGYTTAIITSIIAFLLVLALFALWRRKARLEKKRKKPARIPNRPGD